MYSLFSLKLSQKKEVSVSHLHPPLDRDLLVLPRPVRLAAELGVPHPQSSPPQAAPVGELLEPEGLGPVDQVGEVKVGRVVAFWGAGGKGVVVLD